MKCVESVPIILTTWNSIPGVRQNEAELKILEEAARLHPDQVTVSPSLSFHTWASNPDVITPPRFYDLAHLLP